MSLFDLLNQCTLRISKGTGFFVAPGLILTCFHVVKKDSGLVQVSWLSNQQDYEAEIQFSDSELDLTLLEIRDLEGHPCVCLDKENPEPHDKVYTYGYPVNSPSAYHGGDPRDGTVSGISPRISKLEDSSSPLIRFKGDFIKGGYSGSPLLNCKTEKVCGMIIRSNPNQALEARAVPITVILDRIKNPNLRLLNVQFHSQDTRWTRLSQFSYKDLAPLKPKDKFLNYIIVLLFLIITLFGWFLLGPFSTHKFPIKSAGSLLYSCFTGLFQPSETPLEIKVEERTKDKIESQASINTVNQEIDSLNHEASENWLLSKIIEFLSKKSKDESVPKISTILGNLNRNHSQLEEKLIEKLGLEQWKGRYAGLKLLYFIKPFFQEPLDQDYEKITAIIGNASRLSESEENSAGYILSKLSKDIRSNLRKINPARLALLYRVEDLVRNISRRNASLAESQLNGLNQQVDRLNQQVEALQKRIEILTDSSESGGGEYNEEIQILGVSNTATSEWWANFQGERIKITCGKGVSLKYGTFKVRLQVDRMYQPITTYTVVKVIEPLE